MASFLRSLQKPSSRESDTASISSRTRLLSRTSTLNPTYESSIFSNATTLVDHPESLDESWLNRSKALSLKEFRDLTSKFQSHDHELPNTTSASVKIIEHRWFSQYPVGLSCHDLGDLCLRIEVEDQPLEIIRPRTVTTDIDVYVFNLEDYREKDLEECFEVSRSAC